MHEIKHGAYRLIVQPESKRVAADAARRRWSDPYPLISRMLAYH
jgi:hypothetical protein